MPNGQETLIHYKSQALDLNTFQPLEDLIDANLQAARQDAKAIIIGQLEMLRSELARREAHYVPAIPEPESLRSKMMIARGRKELLDLIIAHVKETSVAEENA
jgi:hypothetical protein